MNPLPASEVRRRGDRMRRRNTVLATVGGVAAAAVFIGTPVAIVANHDGRDDVQPAPSPTPTTDARWLTSMPDDFPLGAGFPEHNADGSPTKISPPGFGPVVKVGQYLCGATWTLKPPVGAAGYEYTGESEDTMSRTLLVFGDDARAATALSELRTAVTDCLENPLKDATVVNHIVDLDLGTESSLVFSQQVVQVDHTISGLYVNEIALSGNALLLNSSYGAAGGDQVVAYEADRLRKNAAPVLSAMCVFSAEPCQITTTQATEPAPDPPSSVPVSDALADFPLDLGYPETNGGDGSPVEITTKPGVGRIDLCGTVAWDPAGGSDVIGVEYAGEGEDLRGRTLAVFNSESEAADAMDNATAALEACPQEASDAESGATNVYGPLGVHLGDQSLGWTLRYHQPDAGAFDTGLTVYHLVRVGNAIYASYEYSEAGRSDGSLGRAVEHATDQARPIVDAMRGL